MSAENLAAIEAEEERLIEQIRDEGREEERGYVLLHIRNMATVARNRANDITVNGNRDDARKYLKKAEMLGRLANEIEGLKHRPRQWKKRAPR